MEKRFLIPNSHIHQAIGLLPKAVSPKHIFDQMEKLSVQKTSLEEEIKNLESSSSWQTCPVNPEDFESFRSGIFDLLLNETNPYVKTSIIQKVVDKIIIKQSEVEIYFLVGETHYKRELALQGGSRPSLATIEAERLHTPPIPAFCGHLETLQFMDLSPNDFNPRSLQTGSAGSNSLTNGRG